MTQHEQPDEPGEPKHAKLAYSVNEFCDLVGISRRHFYNLQQRNQGPPSIRAGNRVLIPAEGVQAWLRQHAA